MEAQQQTQTKPVEPDPETTKTIKPKPKRRRYAGEQAAPEYYRKVRVPPICSPAIFQLKAEMGLRSDGDAILWLLKQARPELVAGGSFRTHVSRPGRKPKSSGHSVPGTVCMALVEANKAKSRLVSVAAGNAPADRSPVRATVVQASTVFFDTPATLDKAERLVASAAAYGSQLLVFPEAFVGGYPRCAMLDPAVPSQSAGADDDFQKYYASAIDVPGPEFDRLVSIARKHNVHLVMGVVERAGFYLFSTVLFFDSSGRHLVHDRKRMLMALESVVWHSGDKVKLPISETLIGRVSTVLGWDNKFPLLRNELYAKGVEIYCAPTADARDVWKASMIHIALEGGCFVLSANQFCRRSDYPLTSETPGDSDGDTSSDEIICDGGSIIISPSGAVLAGPNYQGECLISANLDLGDTIRAKVQFGSAGRISGTNFISFNNSGPDLMEKYGN